MRPSPFGILAIITPATRIVHVPQRGQASPSPLGHSPRPGRAVRINITLDERLLEG